MKYKTILLVGLLTLIATVFGLFIINTQTHKTNNRENNIIKNQANQNLEKWKNKQIKEYKYATNLSFKSWNILKINLEAKQKGLELIPWIATNMDTYANTGLWPLIIRAKKWDKIEVSFSNKLKQATTVHRHGVRVPNEEDGVPWVTQDPIEPGGKYKYTFVVNDPGTFLFHPHKNHSEQIGKWLYGVLIVEDPQEPKYDKEFVWVLKDFRIWSDGKLTEDFGNLMDAVHGGRLGNVITINNIINYKAKVSVWDTIRIRLANMSNARIYNLDLSKLNAKVIATDDSLVNNPKRVYNLELWPGERYDLVLKVEKNMDGLEIFDRYFANRANKLATFKLNGKNNKKAYIDTWTGNLPDWRNAKYNKPDVIIDLWWIWVMWGDQWMMQKGERWWSINGGIFPKTNKPILLQKDKMYIIRMLNKTRRDHPMHLHWDFFQVISVNGMKWEFIGWKDTVNVKPKSYIDVAIIPTNIWNRAFHCHILEHADLGMFTTVKVIE